MLLFSPSESEILRMQYEKYCTLVSQQECRYFDQLAISWVIAMLIPKLITHLLKKAIELGIEPSLG